MEAFLEEVRARRMVATIEYHNLKNAKLSQATVKIRDRLERHLDMLEKEVLGLERAENKVQDRLNSIEELKQEMGFLADQLIDPNEDIGE